MTTAEYKCPWVGVPDGEWSCPITQGTGSGNVMTDAGLREDWRGWREAADFLDEIETNQVGRALAQLAERSYERYRRQIAGYFGYCDPGYIGNRATGTGWPEVRNTEPRPTRQARFPKVTQLEVARGLWLWRAIRINIIDADGHPWVWTDYHEIGAAQPEAVRPASPVPTAVGGPVGREEAPSPSVLPPTALPVVKLNTLGMELTDREIRGLSLPAERYTISPRLTAATAGTQLEGYERVLTAMLCIESDHTAADQREDGIARRFEASQWDQGKWGIAPNYDTPETAYVTSWGVGQVMGWSFAEQGFENALAFAEWMQESPQNEYTASVRFCLQKPGVTDAIHRLDLNRIGYLYNGQGYAGHKYHLRLAFYLNRVQEHNMNIKDRLSRVKSAIMDKQSVPIDKQPTPDRLHTHNRPQAEPATGAPAGDGMGATPPSVAPVAPISATAEPPAATGITETPPKPKGHGFLEPRPDQPMPVQIIMNLLSWVTKGNTRGAAAGGLVLTLITTFSGAVEPVEVFSLLRNTPQYIACFGGDAVACEQVLSHVIPEPAPVATEPSEPPAPALDEHALAALVASAVADAMPPAPTPDPTPDPTPEPTPETPPAPAPAYVVWDSVVTANIHVRDAPSRGADSRGVVNRGTSVTVLGESEDGAWLQLEGGGWVSGEYVVRG